MLKRLSGECGKVGVPKRIKIKMKIKIRKRIKSKKMGVTDDPFLSLKGWNNKAQGIALGLSIKRDQALKGRYNGIAKPLLGPFRAKSSPNDPSQGVALGFHVLPL